MEIKSLAAALVKAQAEMTGAKKDSSNPFFKSKYADLASVDAAIGPALEKHGLGYIQLSHDRDNAACVETVIIHESGETLHCGPVAVPVAKADAQGFGSAMTYARRYSLSAAFGVCPEDDDGNAAAKAAPKSPVRPTASGEDFWNNANPEEKAFLNSCLSDIRDLLNADNAKDAAAYFYGIKDQEEALAIWTQLGSKERASIKNFKPAKE